MTTVEVKSPISVVRYQPKEEHEEEQEQITVPQTSKIVDFVKKNWLWLGIGAGVLYLIVRR